MKIIAYIRSNSGPCYHRILLPLLLMPNVDVYITNQLKVEDFEKGCDLFIYNRVLPQHALPQVKELKKKYEFKTVLDIDDHWQLDPHHILYTEYQETEFAKVQLEQIKGADIVFTTHNRLAAEVEPHNPNVHVLPNAIPKVKVTDDPIVNQFAIERQPCKYQRLFWQGSVTHGEDIALLKTPANALNTIAPKIKMVMAGFVDGETEWDRMVFDYTAGLKHQYRIIPGIHVHQYYRSYEQADICLVPLLNSPFNRHKSNLKVLEAAHLGLPVIASRVHPYLGLPIFYAKCSRDWVHNIKRLVDSKKRQKEAGAELTEYADVHFNFEKINSERKQILEYSSRLIAK